MQLIKIKFLTCVFLFVASTTVVAQKSYWQELEDMPFPVAGGQAVVHNGKIYILGGYSDQEESPVDLIQVYDPVLRTWDVAGHMQGKRSGFIADAYTDSLVICGGIVEDSTKASSLEMWNYSKDPYFFSEDQNFNRLDATGAVIHNNFYIFGGHSHLISQGIKLPYVVVYNIPQNTIVHIDSIYRGDLPYQQMSAYFNNKFYLFGGAYFGISKKVFSYDLIQKKHARTYPDLSNARAAGAATCTEEDKIYLIGGYNEENQALSSVEIYTIHEYGNFNEHGPSLIFPRKEHMSVLFNDTIYVFGGRNANGNVIANVEQLFIAATDVAENAHKLIREFTLKQNYPNPFNANTKISFQLHRPSSIRLDIYSTDGRLIKTIMNTKLSAGNYQVTWDGTDMNQQPVASNIFIYRLATEFASESKKMILVK